MKQKIMSRTLAWLLTLCMVFSLIPGMTLTVGAATETISLGSPSRVSGQTNVYTFPNATVSDEIKVLNIYVESGSFKLTSTTGFSNGVISQSSSNTTVNTSTAYISVQYSGSAPQEALHSIQFTKGTSGQKVIVTGTNVTLGSKDIYYGNQIYQVSNSTMTWEAAMEWSLGLNNTTYSASYTPNPIEIDSMSENNILVNLYSQGTKVWLSAVPSQYVSGSGSITYSGTSVTVSGNPQATGGTASGSTYMNYKWLVSGTLLPINRNASHTLASCWQTGEPNNGGPVYFGYLGAYWDDYTPTYNGVSHWTSNPEFYALTEWKPKSSSSSTSVSSAYAEATVTDSSFATNVTIPSIQNAVWSVSGATLSGGVVSVSAGTSVVLTLAPASGYSFAPDATLTVSGISGASVNKNNNGTFTVTLTIPESDAVLSVGGTVEALQDVTVSNNVSNATLTPTTIKASDGPVKLTLKANEGYSFVGDETVAIGGNNVTAVYDKEEDEYTFTVSYDDVKNLTSPAITASAAPKKDAVVTANVSNATLTSDATGNIVYANQTAKTEFKLTPDNGYAFTGEETIKIGGAEVSGATHSGGVWTISLGYSDVASNSTISCEPAPVKIPGISAENGYVVIQPQESYGSYQYSTDGGQTWIAVPNDVKLDFNTNELAGENAEVIVRVKNNDATITAPITVYKVEATLSPKTTGDVGATAVIADNAGNAYAVGQTAKVNVTPADGHVITGVKVNGSYVDGYPYADKDNAAVLDVAVTGNGNPEVVVETMTYAEYIASIMGNDVDLNEKVSDNKDKAIDGIIKMLGNAKGNDDQKAARELLKDIVPGLTDEMLNAYDDLSDEGKREVVAQLVDKLTSGNANATIGDLIGDKSAGTGLLGDLNKKNDNTVEKFADTMLKMEQSNPTMGAVTDVKVDGEGLADIEIALTQGFTPASGKVYAVVGGNLTEIGTVDAAGEVTTTVALPVDTTAIRVELADNNGFVTVTDTDLIPSKVSATYLDGKTNPNDAYALDSVTSVNTNEAELDTEGESYTKWTPADVCYYTNGDDTKKDANESDEQAITLVITPQNGVYSDFYVDGTKLDETNVKGILGTSAELVTDEDTGITTLTYKASEAKAVPANNNVVPEILAKTRDLISEANKAANNTALEDVLKDADYLKAMSYTGSDTDENAQNALEAYNATLNPEAKENALNIIRDEITEGEDDYTVSEFNAAVKAAFEYAKAIKALEDSLNIDAETGSLAKDENGDYVRNPAFTAGSYDEAAAVYEAVKAVFDTATEGANTIATEELQKLAGKAAKAENQLVASTSGVEIDGSKLPEGVTITATATYPDGTTNMPATVEIQAGSKGYVFPEYDTDVVMTLPIHDDYIVVVDGTELTDDDKLNDSNYGYTVSGVKEAKSVEVEYIRKDVEIPDSLPASITAITDENGNDVDMASSVIEKAAGTLITLTITPDEDDAILAGAKITIDAVDYPVSIDGKVTIPANELANVTDGVISGAITAGGDKLSAIKALAEAVIDSEDDYNIANDKNNDYTESSWNDLKAALDEVNGVAEPSSEQIQALEDAYNALVPQYEIEIPSGLAVVPEQDGVVESGNKAFVTDGASLKLSADAPSGQTLDKVTYKMDKNGDGDTTDSEDQTSTAYPANGIVTIPVITGAVTISAPLTSDKGFAVENGSLGDATGASTTTGNDTYTLTPGAGSNITGVTVDGIETTLPDSEELKAIVEAATASDGEWTENGDNKTYTVADVNGKSVKFTKDADGNITATLPGIGKVDVETQGSTITATVETMGNDKLPVGTEIELEVSGADITSEVIKPIGTDAVIMPESDGKVVIDFGSENTGSHTVSATTSLKVYDVDVSDDAAEAGVKVNGKTAGTIKHGETATITITAPDDTDKEIAKSSTLAGTVKVGGSELINPTLAELEAIGAEIIINNDGSATVKIPDISGEMNITAITKENCDKGTASATASLADNKAKIAELADDLLELLDEADALETGNDTSKLYDENADEWKNLFDADMLDDKDTALYATLTSDAITNAADENALLAALNTALEAATGNGDYTTVSSAITALGNVNTELAKAIDDAKVLADGVVNVPLEATITGAGIENDEDTNVIAIIPADGKINPDGGKDLKIENIDTQDGYLPMVTIKTDKGDKSFVVKADLQAYEVLEDGTVASEPTTEITVAKDGVSGTFDVTVPNSELNNILGFGEPKTIGNITAIEVSGVKQGIILPSAEALKAGLQTGSTNAAGNEDVVLAGGNEDGNSYVVADNDIATITVPLSEDDYYGNVTDKISPNATIWNKKVTGIAIGGIEYTVSKTPEADGRYKLLDSDGNELTGITVEPNAEQAVAVITIATDTEGFNKDLPYETLEIIAEPSNSQYNTFKSEFADVKDLVTDPEALDDATKAELEEAIKTVEKLIAEAAGTIPAPYALTQQNKDYLADEIAQLDAYKDKLTAMHNATACEDGINTLFDTVSGIVPLDKPISDEDKATLAAMESAIKDKETDFNGLTPFEQSIVSQDAKEKLEKMLEALEEAQTDGQTKPEQFHSIVTDIANVIDNNITTDNADIIDSMIRSAEDLYIGMTDGEKPQSAVDKTKLDALKEAFEDFLEDSANDFAKEYLTTDKDGLTEFDNSTNRIDSEPTDEDYADRLIRAKLAFDDLSQAEQAAVDKIFNSPTVPQLYKETFDVDGATILSDEQIADNFIQKYLTINGDIIKEATSSNYNKILTAESPYNALTDTQKDLVNEKLVNAGGVEYPELLASAKVIKASVEAVKPLCELTDSDIEGITDLSDEEKQALKDARDFIKENLMYDGSVITSATSQTKPTIRNANTPYESLSSLAKTAVNGALTGTYKGKTYPELLAASKTSGSSSSSGSSVTTYVKIEKTENGKVTADNKNAAVGKTVTLTVTPADGYVLDKLIVIDSKGNEIELADKGDGKYSFEMPKNRPVTVKATFAEDECDGGKDCPSKHLIDVDQTKWYHEAIDYVVVNGLMMGITSNTFEPDSASSRAMIVTVLHRLEGKPEAKNAQVFDDVAEGQWYTEAIAWAAENDIVLGYGNGSFGPDDNITRQQLAAILYRYAKYKGYDLTAEKDIDHFVDADKIGAWAYEALTWAYNKNIVQGVGNDTMLPGANAQRSEIAAMIMRFCENIAK